ncbi:MAG TPA: alpha/beta fold hydrolase [Cellulomonadaceae bacterium]|nr:alpha/beta fold hydrolase [Cellulomonadaceae bacterium]
MQTILVPPLLCSPLVYRPIIDVAWTHGSVTVADTRHDDTVAGMAARLLRDAPEEFALLGTSMGGYVARDVVRQAPRRVRALVLVSTSARRDTPEQLASREHQSRLVEAGGFDRLVDMAFPGVVAEQHEQDPALLGVWRTMARTVGAQVFLRQQRAVMGRAAARELLSTIGCPTLVIHGADDRLIPAEMGAEIAGAIPRAELVLIEDAGHVVFLEQPEVIASTVADFLDGLTRVDERLTDVA